VELKYANVISAKFISRPNRFLAKVDIDGVETLCHVKNTGRCKELLIPQATVYLSQSDNPKRATGYDLIAVQKGDRLINIDSQAPNKVFAEWLTDSGYIEGITKIKPEMFYGNSRFDFYVEAGKRKIFIEVKGVTLEQYGVVLFPDAPTERGVKHLNELTKAVSQGYEAIVVFVIQMSGAKYFTPNVATHAAFGEALINADKAGVKVLALDCDVEPDALAIRGFVTVMLSADWKGE
jgi:sugar fermentation stimulation protein A